MGSTSRAGASLGNALPYPPFFGSNDQILMDNPSRYEWLGRYAHMGHTPREWSPDAV